jgi:hypothetical protein
MAEIEKVIEIDAPPADVWRVLLDFDAYGEWNPFIRSISGRVEPGEAPSGRRPMASSR